MFLRPTRASLQTGSLAVQGPDLQKYLTPILRQCQHYDRLTTDV